MKKNETPKPLSKEWDKQLFYCAQHQYRVTGMDCDRLHETSDECEPDCPLRGRHQSICKGIEQMAASETVPETEAAPAAASLEGLHIGIRGDGESKKFYYSACGEPILKICSRCKTPKKITDFNKNNGFRHNITSMCKDCDAGRHKAGSKATPGVKPKAKPKATPEPVKPKLAETIEQGAEKDSIKQELEASPDLSEQLIDAIFKNGSDRITRVTVTFEMA